MALSFPSIGVESWTAVLKDEDNSKDSRNYQRSNDYNNNKSLNSNNNNVEDPRRVEKLRQGGEEEEKRPGYVLTGQVFFSSWARFLSFFA